MLSLAREAELLELLSRQESLFIGSSSLHSASGGGKDELGGYVIVTAGLVMVGIVWVRLEFVGLEFGERWGWWLKNRVLNPTALTNVPSPEFVSSLGPAGHPSSNQH